LKASVALATAGHGMRLFGFRPRWLKSLFQVEKHVSTELICLVVADNNVAHSDQIAKVAHSDQIAEMSQCFGNFPQSLF